MIRSLALLAALAACAQPPSDLCDIGASSSALTAADRKIVGVAADYEADTMLRGRDDELRHSRRTRREVAWATVAKVLAPVPLSQTLPKVSLPDTVPAWQTWYARDDINRLFNKLYAELAPGSRHDRARFTDIALDDAFGWNARAVEELPNWPEQRWLDYLADIDEAAEVGGVGGVARVAYGPSGARHLLTSYPDILQCMESGSPAAFVDTPGEATRRMVHEPVALDRCRLQSFGPFFVGGGETLRAVVDGPVDAGAVVSVRPREPDAGARTCRAGPGEPCEVTGTGAFYVEVRAGNRGLDGALTVDYDEPHPDWAACLDGAFPPDAVVIKASWRRAQLDMKLPTWKTDGDTLAAMLSADGGADWGGGDGEADPGPDDIYTIKLPNGNVFRLAALHVMTKELDHWLWITLWWAPDANQDFGQDRPDSITSLGGPWSNYKMCTTTAFAEADPDPEAGYGDSAPSLARALAAVARSGAPSWCSNPYLELGAGNADTNCIGCHQHGGTGVIVDDIIADEARFPAHGRTELRNNFPHDYSFAVDAGDRIGQLFADVVEFYDTSE